MVECQRCGEPIIEGQEIISYHKDHWVDFQQELIAIARGKQWRKLEGSETTEYYED